MTDTTTDTVITFDPRAIETLRDMQQQAAAVERAWRTIKPEWAAKTSHSLAMQLINLIGMGNTRVWRDGEISLVGQNFIQFGLIGFPIERADHPTEDARVYATAPRNGLFCLAQVPSGGYCTKPVHKRERTCTGHDSEIWSMPLPIEWSIHS